MRKILKIWLVCFVSAAVVTSFLPKPTYAAPAYSAQIVVNDPAFSANPLDIDKQWGLIKAGFDQAWAKTTGSRNNVVAVIDTGIDETHEDLRDQNFVIGFDFVNHQPINVGTDSDDNGHGTMVAGVLGAIANNGRGIAGTNWQISLMPIKALDSTGKGDAATLSQAIIWASDHGANFINLSLGGVGAGHDTILSNAVTYAFNKNVLIVAAAGNDNVKSGGSLDQNPVYPVCDDNNQNMVLGVAATDQNDLKADFSNYGHNCIDVTAPGKRILSTINHDPLTQNYAPNSYAYGSGSSMAVPFVVGEAALIRTQFPYANNTQIRDLIISSADNIDDLNLSQCGGGSCAGLLGAGRIDAYKALQSTIVQGFSEGDVVKDESSSLYYLITGGQKRLISSFVFNQRFAGLSTKLAQPWQLDTYPAGPYATPNDGTLVKYSNSPTVYIAEGGQKMPITGLVFLQRHLDFSAVNTLSNAELDSWLTGSFYAPVDGTLVRGYKNPGVYWVVDGVLHPVSSDFYKSRGLNIFPIMLVPDNDINSYARGEAYI